MNKWTTAVLIVALALCGSGVGRAAEPKSTEPTLDQETAEAIASFKKTDSKLTKVFKESAGYAIFPSIAKGAAGIGAAHGEGEVFAKGKQIGVATMTQVTLGLQLGGQEYSELIFFETKEALDEFAAGQWAMSAQATAVAVAEGAGSTAKYQQGVMVFVLVKGGLMFEASIGGQKFKFTPLKNVPKY